MPLPRPADVQALGRHIDTYDITQAVTALTRALTRAGNVGPTLADGYRTGPTTGHTGTLTSVEAAASRRITPRTDDLDAAILRAWHHLAAAATALDMLTSAIHAIYDLDTKGPLVDNTAGCWALARIGAHEPIHARATINGDPHPLGRWAYDFWNRVGRLPTIAECRTHTLGGRIRLPA